MTYHETANSKQQTANSKQQTANKPNFRSDINGLRAWACLAVVFFHFQILNFQGGFVGVDVFFVISGYLMTAILHPKLISQQINILQFYTQRLKRVFPALFAMLFILVSAGSFILYNKDFYHLVHEVKVALAFYYNIHFKETDYFSESTTDWLTHTWTLGVEFQFYLLFPILLLMIDKITKNIKHHIAILSLIALCSFIAMQYQVHLKPNQAFFLLQYRVWEFLAGAILFLIQYKQTIISQKYTNPILVVGWISLILFFLLMNDGGHYPDFRTLIPVLATVAILYPIKNTILTDNPIAQYLGSASYSIYLWHWSIYVLIGLYGYHENVMALYGFALLSILVGCISYEMIEKGAVKLFNKIPNHQKQLPLLICTIIISSLLLDQIKQKELLIWVKNHPAQDILSFQNDKSEHAIDCHVGKRNDCIFGDTQAQVGLIVVGDSHSASLLPILDKMAKEHQTAIATFMASSCPMSFNIQVQQGISTEKIGLFCLDTLKRFKQSLQQYPNAKVFIINRHNLYLLGRNEENNKYIDRYFYQQPIDFGNNQDIQVWQQQFTDDLLKSTCEIAKTHQTFWLKSIPEIGLNVPKTLADNIFYHNNHDDIKIPISSYQQRQYFISPIEHKIKQQCHISFIDISSAFCDQRYCYGSSNHQVYYYDDNHLSITGSELARPYLEVLFQNNNK